MISITAEIITSFRTAYPAFSNVATWPDAVLTTALCDADAETGGSGWGAYSDECSNFKQRGMFLFAAHWLATTYPNGATDITAMNGGANQLVQSKSVGDESISYASISEGMSAGNAWLASTSFGQQFMRLRRRAGMGARAV
jgi:hypothetical protein